MKLWKLNRITGYWQYVRDCEPATAAQWLAIFQQDEPDEQFKLSTRKPK